MGSILDQIELTKNTKENIKNAIKEKGIEVLDTDKFSEYPDKIRKIDEWQPQSDWWDIKKIVKEDTEDYPAKIIILFQDITLIHSITQPNFLNAEKIVFSDGQVLTEPNKSITFNKTKLKPCSQGYNTYYAIVYLKNTELSFSYTNFDNQFLGLLWLYFYKVETVTINSAFSWSNNNSLCQAIESDRPMLINPTSASMSISNSYFLKKLPNVIFSIDRDYILERISVTNSLLKYEEYIKLFKNCIINPNLSPTTYQSPDINKAFFGEHINFNDFTTNTVFHKITNLRHIDGPYSIEEIDFENVTQMTNGGCKVTNINKISNIKTNNNWFNNDTVLNHDTLIRILNALYDYSEQEDVYQITLGNINLSKLTDEEKQIATDKGWTLS